MDKINEITIGRGSVMDIGDRVVVRENVKFYKNRTGKIVDTCIYNDKKKFKVILDNFCDIPMWFWESELGGLSNDRPCV